MANLVIIFVLERSSRKIVYALNMKRYTYDLFGTENDKVKINTTFRMIYNVEQNRYKLDIEEKVKSFAEKICKESRIYC